MSLVIPDIPKIPTDSLYKFLAIGSTVLMLASLVLMFFLMGYETPEVKNAKAVASSFTERDSAIDIYRSRMDSINVSFYVQSKTDTGVRNYMSSDSMRQKRLIFFERIEKMKLDLRLDYAVNRSIAYGADSDYTAYTLTNIWLLYFVFAIGMVMSLFGYMKWYENLQKYKDMLVRQQAGFSNAKLIEEEEKIAEENRVKREQKRASKSKK